MTMTDAGSPLTQEAHKAIAALIARIAVQGKEDPRSIKRASELFEGAVRADALHDLLTDMVPSAIDIEQWMDWLDGGLAPAPVTKLVDPDRDHKIKARGAHYSAVRNREALAREVIEMEAKLADKRSLLAEAERAVLAADSHLRQVVVYRLMTDLSRHLAGVFSMGPAWTLMRSVSSYVRRDPGYERSLDEAARTRVAALYDNLAADSTEMLALLDHYVGDTQLEIRLRGAIQKILRDHHEPVRQELAGRNYDAKKLSTQAKRPTRRTEERKAMVRDDTGALSDRHDVLRGLSINGIDIRDADDENF
jgi:hypothetical protein